MSRKFLIPLLTAVFLATPAFVPVMITSLSGSALAQKTLETNALNLNTSRSNIYRTNKPGSTTNANPNKPGKTKERMGGGGGRSGGY